MKTDRRRFISRASGMVAAAAAGAAVADAPNVIAQPKVQWRMSTAWTSFTKFQALVGPWDHVAEGAYHQFVAT